MTTINILKMIGRMELAKVEIFYFASSEFETSPQKDENWPPGHAGHL